VNLPDFIDVSFVEGVLVVNATETASVYRYEQTLDLVTTHESGLTVPGVKKVNLKVCHSLIKELEAQDEMFAFNYTIPLDEETYLEATEKLSIPF
jgi:hypothetical protein